MSHSATTVTDQSFPSEVLQSAKPVLVDYWAQWCVPCRMMEPIVEEFAADYADRLTITKLNVDENPVIPSRYGVRGIPTLMLFKDGQPIAARAGSLSRAQLHAFIDAHIGTRPERATSGGGN